jgi:hypothetical protein
VDGHAVDAVAPPSDPSQPGVQPAVKPPSGSSPVYDFEGLTRRVPLGVLAGARSGDKGGSCTLGVYTRTDEAFQWLAAYLTVERLAQLLPEARDLGAWRQELPNVRAVLFQIPGLLGQGVAAATRFDPQAKSVGEWLRSRWVDAPIALLDDRASAGQGHPVEGSA